MTLSCGKPSAGRPRAADQEARLQNLLQTASRLFLEHGYGNVSLETIAREAHVAVRTIYVKFGGKAGLVNAMIVAARARYFSTMLDMQTDTRPVEQVLDDFGQRFLALVSRPEAVSLNRMVVAEAKSNPELADTFQRAGPGQTRELLFRYFGRPDIKVLFRADMPAETLGVHLLNCIMGDQLTRLMVDRAEEPDQAELERTVKLGLELFFRGTLR